MLRFSFRWVPVPERCVGQAVTGSMEEPAADAPFQIGEMMAQGRLREMQRAGGRRDAAGVRDGDNQAQIPHLDMHGSHSPNTSNSRHERSVDTIDSIQ